jgi:hypothetical protein
LFLQKDKFYNYCFHQFLHLHKFDNYYDMHLLFEHLYYYNNIQWELNQDTEYDHNYNKFQKDISHSIYYYIHIYIYQHYYNYQYILL